MPDRTTLAMLLENVALSRSHVARQEAIITAFVLRGQSQMAETAKDVLRVMRDHLATEIEMLERYKASDTQ